MQLPRYRIPTPLTAGGLLSFVAVLAAISAIPALGNQPASHASFREVAVPFLETHCNGCHSVSDPEGGLSLAQYELDGNVQNDYELWEKVIRFVVDRQMPPADETQPDEAEILDFVSAVRDELATFDCTGERHPGRVTLRRLNRAEYNNTIRDLLGLEFQPADDFPADDVGNGFDNIGDVLSMPPLLMEKYLDAAADIADRTFADPEVLGRIMIVEESEEVSVVDAIRQNISQFATRAFRRPVREAEVERLMEMMIAAYRSGAEREEVAKMAIQAILVSPHFLFRVEADPRDDDADGIRELNDYELASRLSYFLWSSMPDAELFELAERGKLSSDSALKHQVARMLADPKSEALVENFAGQWLQLRDVDAFSPDPDRFPQFDEQLRLAAKKETSRFFADVMRNDRSILTFLNADYSFLNERIAAHYGIDGVEGDHFRKVPLDSRRRGILTQASILLITSNPTRTSPVKRGKWILENMLGTPPPPPPPGVPELSESGETLGTLREQMEQHRSNEACAVCHRDMDTLGFGLENFDVTGAWRDQDGRFAIDPSGTLPGGLSFAGPADLMQVLAEEKKDAFCRALSRKMLTYALGRGLTTWDRCTVDRIMEQLATNDYRFQTLVTEIVLSEPFRYREAAGEE